MPTPLALTVGLPHPGGDFREPCTQADDDIPVFVVSGRNLKTEADGPDPFGTERSHQATLAIAYVKIGEGLTAEELFDETTCKKRRKQAKVEFSGIELNQVPLNVDPWRVKDEVVRHDGNPWVKAINKQLESSPSRNVTIFVHGYNTEFIDNTLLAAEIFHYMGRNGAMISFEWPSESRLFGYIADKGNATYSTRHFRAMISNVAKECNVDSITIVAHSAGSPIVVNALREIRLLEYDLPAEEVQAKYRVSRVVLAAPDMDLMAFINAVHDRFHEVAGKVAVYASPKDQALRLSEKIYGDQRLGRSVGRLRPWERQVLQSVPEIELVDASVAENIYRSFIGHSYFHRDPWVSSDIGAFMVGLMPQERGLTKQTDEIFWRFPKDYPDRLEMQARLIRESREIELQRSVERVAREPESQPLVPR